MPYEELDFPAIGCLLKDYFFAPDDSETLFVL